MNRQMKLVLFQVLLLALLLSSCSLAPVSDEDAGLELRAATFTSLDLERAYFIGAYASVGAYDTRTDAATRTSSTKRDSSAEAAINSLKKHGWTIRNYEKTGAVDGDFFKLDAQYLLATKSEGGKNVYVVAFRGSEFNLSDWAGSDFDILPVKFLSTGTLVHRGFLQYTMPAYNNSTLRSTLAKVKADANAMLIVTGHSLGGAAATLYGAMAVEYGVPKARINIITFVQPAVGQPAFETRYTAAFNCYVSVVRLGDVVVVSTTAANYRQFGTKIQASGSINPATAHSKDAYLTLAKSKAPQYAGSWGAD